MDNSNEKKWFEDYFQLYSKTIFQSSIIDKLTQVKEIWLAANKNSKKIIFAGNGGSAAMASHCSVDLTKNAGIRAINFNQVAA